MKQLVGLASDLMALLLSGGRRGLGALAEAVRGAGGALPPGAVRPDQVAAAVEQVAAGLPARRYGEPQADIAAAALEGAGQTLPERATLAALEAEVLRVLGGAGRALSGLEAVAVALARLRSPLVRRGRLLGLTVGAEPLSPAPVSVRSAVSIGAAIADTAFLKEFMAKVNAEQERLGRVNILIAGKTGVGKSTLVNAVFGAAVAQTGAGRPVTQNIAWHEPPGLPVRLCDTKGLELADYDRILADLEAEIARGEASRRAADRVHVLWLCVLEMGRRIEAGEQRVAELCRRRGIPVIVVLTQAIGGRGFAEQVPALVPGAAAVVRVLAEKLDDDPPRAAFGLDDLIRATDDVLPEAIRNAFDAVQRVLLDGKRGRALQAAGLAAGAAGVAAMTPLPLADAGAVLAVNVGMIARIAAVMGVQLSAENVRTLAGSVLAAMAVTGGGRLIAGELLKLVPGVGTIAGGAITSGVAASATYGLGYGFTEFLCRFHQAEQRMPQGEEIREGFRRFWQRWDEKEKAPPKAP